jgi:hypothetical protein
MYLSQNDHLLKQIMCIIKEFYFQKKGYENRYSLKVCFHKRSFKTGKEACMEKQT